MRVRTVAKHRPSLSKKQKRVIAIRAICDELEATNTLIAIHLRHMRRVIVRAQREGLWPR
jgi:hypothetical protein